MRYNRDQQAQRLSRDLRTTARAIRRSRTLEQQQAIARRGEHPLTGSWWPRWKEWTHATDIIRSIMTRFTSGPHGTGARAGRIGGRSRSLAKATAARRNGRLSTGRPRADHGKVAVLRSPRNGPVSAAQPRPDRPRPGGAR
jgi:hypothetical protein